MGIIVVNTMWLVFTIFKCLNLAFILKLDFVPKFYSQMWFGNIHNLKGWIKSFSLTLLNDLFFSYCLLPKDKRGATTLVICYQNFSCTTWHILIKLAKISHWIYIYYWIILESFWFKMTATANWCNSRWSWFSTDILC